MVKSAASNPYAAELIEAGLYFADCVKWLYELCALFEAIGLATEEFTTARGVATAGYRLSEDRAVMLEQVRDRFMQEARNV